MIVRIEADEWGLLVIKREMQNPIEVCFLGQRDDHDKRIF